MDDGVDYWFYRDEVLINHDTLDDALMMLGCFDDTLDDALDDSLDDDDA